MRNAEGFMQVQILSSRPVVTRNSIMEPPLKTDVKRINPTRVTLTITVDQEGFKPALDKAYATVATQVNIPGFRKGKVPAAVLDQRVGKDAIIAQAINDGLDTFYRDALASEKLRPLDTPQADIKSAPDAKEPTRELVVELEVEVEPEFEMPNYKGIAVKVDPIKVAKLDVETRLLRLNDLLHFA